MFMVKQSIGCIILHDKDIVIHFLPHIRVTRSSDKYPLLALLLIEKDDIDQLPHN